MHECLKMSFGNTSRKGETEHDKEKSRIHVWI